MKKSIILIAAFLFATPHMQTNDKDLQLALKGKYSEALKGFERRCQNSDGYACGMVGYFYNKGFGVEKNTQKALYFYKKGCKLNDNDSCIILAYNYKEKGELKKAKDLLNKACKNGSKDACNYLSKITK